ncbi:MAG TPA: ASPIC/UnbV domain-containing protein, partial [Vicinamibacterales bacterium]|nr:ASPIC/UnbV domain-containing protein [Vicinamibacterales bacterium]
EIVEDGTRRSVYKHVNSGGTFGANPLRQTIGLGKATVVETLEVFWPTTGLTQTFTDVAVDRALQISEASPSYSTLPLQRLTPGRPSSSGSGHDHKQGTP